MRKLVIFLFLIILILLIISKKEKVFIPDNAIRIRVIANSNSLSDQQIKANIKNEVDILLYDRLKGVNNYNEAKEIIKSSTKEIKQIVNKYSENNDVIYGNNYFPEKSYKGVNYKEGNYESLLIKIGEGKGNNFWCVLFPPLCMIDESKLGNISYSYFINELLKKFK